MKKILLFITMLGIYLNATPVTLNNTGLITKLEKFTSICTYYSKTIKKPQHIRQQCQKYKRRLDDILRTGYRLDKSIPPIKHAHFYNGEMHTCTKQSHKGTSYNSRTLKNYRTRLFSLDKLRGKIIEKISREKTKARKSYDVVYHEKLIREGVIPLYDSDYTFIDEHIEVYANASSPIYMKMLAYKKEQQHAQKAQKAYNKKQDVKNAIIANIAKIQDAKNAKIEDAKNKEEALKREKWNKMCGFIMTAEVHYNEGKGYVSGKVTGSEMDGYFVESYNLNKAIFYVKGGPSIANGGYASDIPVISYGKKMPTEVTNATSGVKTTSMALVVEYNRKCKQ